MTCLLTAVVAIALMGSSWGEDTCTITEGSRIKMHGPLVRLRSPCKFNMIHQKCGDYKVTITPGMHYLLPNYILDTVWIGVEEKKTGNSWHGRTTNQKTGKAIIWGIEKQPPLAREDEMSTIETNTLFTYSNTSHDITFHAANGDFEITMGPYDFNGNKVRDSSLSFTCHRKSAPEPFPKQYCGDQTGMDLKERAMELWNVRKAKKLKTRDYERTFLYHLFDDTSIAQVNEHCQAATEAFTQNCTTVELKREAIDQCHQILTDDKRTECVQNHACEPIRIFKACVQFVCGGYDYDDACQELGEGIDLCRKIGVNVTEEMKKPKANGYPGCYRDLFTWEDNPFYPEEEEIDL